MGEIPSFRFSASSIINWQPAAASVVRKEFVCETEVHQFSTRYSITRARGRTAFSIPSVIPLRLVANALRYV